MEFSWKLAAIQPESPGWKIKLKRIPTETGVHLRVRAGGRAGREGGSVRYIGITSK